MNARPALLLTCLIVAACSQQESAREIDWAKAALARNPDYEIIATDENTGVFTVRDTGTGTVSTLKLKDLIAAPLPPREAARPAPPSVPAPAEPVEAPEDSGSALADDQTTETLEPVPAGQGAPVAQGPGYSITRGTGNKPEAASAPLEGPGYSVVRQEGTRTEARRQGNEMTPEREPLASNVERRTDPIICQGDRLMRIDGETIDFAGDAVIAEKGCDLYISNAHIRAGGVGIIARQARVHIANSIISGVRASYEVSEGAEIYVAQSTFTGIGRRFDGASMTDLGGNSYATH